MTSNLGSQMIQEYTTSTKNSVKRGELEEKIFSIIKANFKPEFINRLDDIIIFHSLDKEMLNNIIEKQLKLVQQRLQKQDVKINFSQNVKDLIGKEGFDPAFGARPIKRVIQNKILDEIALRIVEGEIKPGDQILIDIRKNKIIVS